MIKYLSKSKFLEGNSLLSKLLKYKFIQSGDQLLDYQINLLYFFTQNKKHLKTNSYQLYLSKNLFKQVYTFMNKSFNKNKINTINKQNNTQISIYTPKPRTSNFYFLCLLK